MTDLRASILEHLERLVAFDTRNPPRAIDSDGLFAYLRERLPSGTSTDLVDLGDGCVYLRAWRGAPNLLVNVHVDTVPAAAGWSSDPHRLVTHGERVSGLGACDIKGAAAALLAVIHTTPSFELLFSSDEEAGQSRCLRSFLDRNDPPARVLVAEPTQCRAVSVHRGIATANGTFRGVAGHASAARALTDSALHEAVRWSSRALQWSAESERRATGGLTGARFNLGTLEGGTKANMIASEAKVRFGLRPAPGQTPRALLDEAFALAADPSRVQWEPGFIAPPLPAPTRPLEAALADAERMARELELPAGEPVDFWTEAALFSEAGSTALVYGPGDIAQAHAADEWVAVDQLIKAAQTYRRIVGGA